jgi:hypothetical protein
MSSLILLSPENNREYNSGNYKTALKDNIVSLCMGILSIFHKGPVKLENLQKLL